ncbi:transcriptional regulator, AlpA family [Rhodospirillales bacterium URHD0017]|nr:transcriptional regulator, AlpA family [Rhodospirillales bacterium URHD0017]
MHRRLTNRAATQPRRGLDHDEAATYLGITFTTFDRLVTEGRLPKPVDLGGEVVWDVALLDKAMDRLSGLRRTTAD